MLTTTDVDSGQTETPTPTPARTRWRTRLALIAVVAFVASPIVVAELQTVGMTWTPLGDWAHMVYRTSQVFSTNIPLVGAYTTKGWAHPGPLDFWLSAPLYELTGDDPRALLWTAGIINVASIAGIAAVAWRRGRWPWFLTVMAFTATIVYAFGPNYLADIWNPFVALLPFLLAVFLLYEAAGGRRRALVEATIAASFAMQSHLAFVVLTGLLLAWGVAWAFFWPKAVPADAGGYGDQRALLGDGVGPPRPTWSAWRRPILTSAVVAVLLWIGPILDALFDLRNPINVVRSFGSDEARYGYPSAISLLGRYVRPDGPWVGGPEPTKEISAVGSGPFPLVLAIVVLGLCLYVARRRRFVDVGALVTMTFVLVVGTIPSVAQFLLPAELYLTQWLKIVGGLVWFTATWTVWRLVEPWVRRVRARAYVGAGLAALAIVLPISGSWSRAADFTPPLQDDQTARAVQTLVARLDGKLPKDEPIDVVHRGESWHITGPAVIYEMIEQGYDVRTKDGQAGLKWGHEHLLEHGDDVDRHFTIAIHNAGGFSDAYTECVDDGARLIAEYDGITAAERSFLSDVRLRTVSNVPISPADQKRADALAEREIRIGLFESDKPCADIQVLHKTGKDTEPLFGE